jgi:diguanylate cyclase (GGDEF)-like protein
MSKSKSKSKQNMFKIPLTLKILVLIQLTALCLILNKDYILNYFNLMELFSSINPLVLTSYLVILVVLLMLISAVEFRSKVNKPMLLIKRSLDFTSEVDSQYKSNISGVNSIFDLIEKSRKDKSNSNFLKENVITEIDHPFLILDVDNKHLYSSLKLNKIINSQSKISSDLDNLSTGECIEYKVLEKVSYYEVNRSIISRLGIPYKLIELKDITCETNLSRKLKEKSHIDELTSVYTRFSFTEYAETYKSLLEEGDYSYLAIIDINDFKLINDSAGHHTGDVILMEVSNLIMSLVSSEEIIGRLSGDEFVILFKSTSKNYLETVLTSIYNEINDYRIDHCDTHLSISVSIGVSVLDASPDNNVQQCLQEADFAAMTARKTTSLFKFYSTNDHEVMYYKEAPIWINRIKSAISFNDFSLFVQEINPINNDNPRHLEVLLRMKDGSGGYYPPYRFLGIAERFSLMKNVDEWVVSNTFKKVSEGLISQNLSINLSGDSIKDAKLIEKLIVLGKYYEIVTKKIIFEITETMVIDDLDGAIENIKKLKAEGYGISLDDFGSGFSTFKYIQCIPADYLKIDGIFIQNLTNNVRDKIIVSNIIQIAHELNMKCVAEFVEDKETAITLQDMGVDYLQGYYLHKPEEMSDWKSR